MIASPIEKFVEDAKAMIAAGNEATAVLSLPAVKEFFISRAVDHYQEFLEAGSDEARLISQLKAKELNALYESLSRAVGAGSLAAERLAEMAKQQESKK